MKRNKNKLSKFKKGKVLEKYNHQCVDCGAKGLLEIHHKVSRVDGGSNKLDNLVVICWVCHVKIHGGTPKRLIKNPLWVKLRGVVS